MYVPYEPYVPYVLTTHRVDIQYLRCISLYINVSDGINSYTCLCSGTGYTGSRCETNVDDCSSSACQHGGTCVDQVVHTKCLVQCTLFIA